MKAKWVDEVEQILLGLVLDNQNETTPSSASRRPNQNLNLLGYLLLYQYRIN